MPPDAERGHTLPHYISYTTQHIFYVKRILYPVIHSEVYIKLRPAVAVTNKINRQFLPQFSRQKSEKNKLT